MFDDILLDSTCTDIQYSLTILEDRNMALFGTRDSGGVNEDQVSAIAAFYFYGSIRSMWGNAYIDEKHSIGKDLTTTLNINSGNTQGAFKCSNPFCLFTNWTDGVLDSRIAYVDFRYLKITDNTGKIRHYLRPCILEGDVPGIIDLVTKKKYKPYNL